MVELVQELEKVVVPDSLQPFLDETIAEAKAGEYHDYKNEKYIEGKTALVARLRHMNLMPLAERVMDGEFDEEADEEDRANMRKDIYENSSSDAQAEAMCKMLNV